MLGLPTASDYRTVASAKTANLKTKCGQSFLGERQGASRRYLLHEPAASAQYSSIGSRHNPLCRPLTRPFPWFGGGRHTGVCLLHFSIERYWASALPLIVLPKPLLAMVLIALATFLAGPVNAQENQSFNEPVNSPRVIARGGGFPSLQPRNTQPSAQQLGEAIDPSAYRVSQSDDRQSENHGATTEVLTTEGRPLEASPDSSRSKMTGPLVTVCSSLAIVLALFSALVWAGRRFGGGASTSKPLPASALTPLGHIMLDPRTKLMLVKCGRRILVLSQTASGIQPITEVTHPDEVRELVASCSAEAREVFEKTLREIELEPARGFTGQGEDAPQRQASVRSKGRLFATA